MWRLASLHVINLNRSSETLTFLAFSSCNILQTLQITQVFFEFDISIFPDLKTLILVTPPGDFGRSNLYDSILISAPRSLTSLSLGAVNLLSDNPIPFPPTSESLHIKLRDGVRKGSPAPPPDRPAFIGLLDFIRDTSSPLNELRFEVNNSILESGKGSEPVGYTSAMRSALAGACGSGGVRVASELKQLPVVEVSSKPWDG